jgi:hypothetical protein
MAEALADPPLRNPTIGIAVCCVRATTGQATAAPPRGVMNWWRLMYSSLRLSTTLLAERKIPRHVTAVWDMNHV